MKKLLLTALLACCGVSFGFGASYLECKASCTLEVDKAKENCIQRRKCKDTECRSDCYLEGKNIEGHCLEVYLRKR